jgi:hypothetical protein
MVMLAALACSAFGLAVRAQVAPEPPIHLASVEGYIVDTSGKPLVHADVSLEKDGAVAYKTSTDDAGAFHFDRVQGDFLFRVARTQFAPAAREIHVGELIQSYVMRKKLYVIVGPGACMDECSTIFTNKHDFQKAVQKKNKK